MQLGDQRVGNNAEDRRGFGMIMGGLGIAAVAIAVFAYFLGIAPGAVLNIAAQVGAQREEPNVAPTDGIAQVASRQEAAALTLIPNASEHGQ